MQTSNTSQSDLPLAPTRLGRAAYRTLGLGFVGLGTLGVFLPLLPTTVFMLLAAACFARSSPRFYHWLLNHRWFGPTIHAWRRHRRIPLRAKRAAVVLIVLAFGVSILVAVDSLYARLALAALAAAVIGYVARIPSLDSLPRD